jgi:hypothetical protein
MACSRTDSRELEIESNDETVSVSLTGNGKINYLECRVNDTLTSTWPLRYPVYKFLKCDVNNDGQEDVAVGVIKPTRNDPVPGKRLFLFQVKNRSVIPLWLGSSLSQPLEDFAAHTVDSTVVIRSIEIEKSKRYLVAEYEWFGFGLSFRKYIQRELSLEDARDLLDE